MDNDSNKKTISRRNFMQNLIYGGTGVVVIGSYGILFDSPDLSDQLQAIVVDFNKCTGCRTCETVCSANNHKVKVNGEELKGVGDPQLSNIKVYHYNPDIDIPVTCNLCPDNPCISACPIPPDRNTGYKALYRNKTTFTITNDKERCFGCGECAKACRNMRTGVIVSNPETGMPESICTLCDGEPQCVKYCPYGALSLVKVDTQQKYYGMSTNAIAENLIEHFYNIKTQIG